MSRWITVANRLPFSLSSNKRQVVTSSGGLVSALSGVQTNGERIWVGCAPEGVTESDWAGLQGPLSESSSWIYHPIFPSNELYDAYYNNCGNDVLWPLLHYESQSVKFHDASWAAYREVNQMFANEIAKIAESDDLIWVHDFHLFLLPKMLKELRPELRIGFFLHVPFPSSEIFRQLPVREEILDSLLSCDLIGFHDYSYLRHFSSSLLRILGIESEFLSIRRGGHTTRLGVFPVSIDTDHFTKKSRDPKVRALTKDMAKNHFMFLGVDRLDYIKGLDLKLKAFRTLLRRFPEYKEKVSLLQVAVPSRKSVPMYMRLGREIARLVGEINGEFSTPNWSPIRYLHSSVTNDQLIALYKAADGLLVTSKRDGMNLVALEYVASQDSERPGVVLLSEFAGALSTLSHTIPVNPWDLEDTARKMQTAMEMPRQERLNRVQAMQGHLHRYTATDWAESFIAQLDKQAPESESRNKIARIGPENVQKLADRILSLNASRVVLFLDYDGTTVPIEAAPELATLSEESKKTLRSFCRYPWLDIVVVSGRDSRFLNTQFGDLPVRLAAEHGGKYFDPLTGRWKRRVHRSRSTWYPTALKIISDYTDRVPHTRIEKKQFAVAWHYRQAPPEYAEFQALKLAEELEFGLANLPVNILRGKKVIEVRAIEANKGSFADSYMEDILTNSVALAIGDDKTDEDLFLSTKGRGVSCKVGPGDTSADFVIPLQSQVMTVLEKLLAELDSHLNKGVVSGATSNSVVSSATIRTSTPMEQEKMNAMTAGLTQC